MGNKLISPNIYGNLKSGEMLCDDFHRFGNEIIRL